MTFDDFDFHENIADSLYYMNFKKATPIQEKAIPKIMEGQDLLATAQTGTGKTAAFMLPVLNKLAENPSSHIDTLVVVPTRELALQIDQQVQGFSYYVEASSIALYGGGDGIGFNEQRQALKNGVNIIVATPGKLISHLNMGYVDLSNLKHFILDEADRMLDMGFIEDIKKIIKYLPPKRQNLMFSATMPISMRKLTSELLNNHYEIKIAVSKPAEGVKQSKYEVYDNQKITLITDIIEERDNYNSILIFTSTKKMVFKVVNQLRKKGINTEGISSDLSQNEREESLLNFRSKKTKVIVATDVLSRGIDIKDINLVINFDVPNDAEDYVHRIGRTARAETKGEAITLVNEDDAYKMLRIERLIEKAVEKNNLPESYDDAPVFSTKTTKKPKSKHNNQKKNYTSKKKNNLKQNSSQKPYSKTKKWTKKITQKRNSFSLLNISSLYEKKRNT